ncbi:MAG TPA: ATPase domain-containing protein [Ramlibacter sp.]|jgi:circadian clock protein KaiC|uniref:ATPase domain-containing protein n=1 Tax=Ramlibacter sp. TaxID=1917967 RepID=UPI002D2ADE75|nr:ATPase domain-containing protein [Ramlibacter sp.]HZY18439.1 ATPase domain-containing protein [Ramlibacter sp.]
MQDAAQPDLLSTGIPGLDTILGGGLTPHRVYLIEGEPGAGKTTTGLQFLQEGVRRGESVVYITLAENRDELAAVAASHGWDLDGMHVHEVLPNEDLLAGTGQYSMFHPSEVELADTLKTILAVVEERQPSRVVLDSLSELQLLAESPLRYRRQVLALKQYFSSRRCTVLLLDDRTASANGDLQVRSIAHGVIQLDHSVKDYGVERRRLRVVKLRGRPFIGGLHDYNLVRGGLDVHPRLIAAESRAISGRQQMSSGVKELDTLMGGGVEEGTSTLIIGPPGTGKSSLAAQFVAAANARGEAAAMFLFEESASNMLHRADGLNLPLRAAIDSGLLTVQQVDPAELSPGQFAAAVRAAVARGTKVLVIDSLNGYLNAVPDERFLTTYLHELLTFLGQHQVMTLLVGVQQGMLGGNMSSAMDASYVADNVLMLRYYELDGEIRQAVSVFKKRGSTHERTIRAFSLGHDGIRVGQILRGYRGLLSGVPVQVAPGGDAD